MRWADGRRAREVLGFSRSAHSSPLSSVLFSFFPSILFFIRVSRSREESEINYRKKRDLYRVPVPMALSSRACERKRQRRGGTLLLRRETPRRSHRHTARSFLPLRRTRFFLACEGRPARRRRRRQVSSQHIRLRTVSILPRRHPPAGEGSRGRSCLPRPLATPANLRRAFSRPAATSTRAREFSLSHPLLRSLSVPL